MTARIHHVVRAFERAEPFELHLDGVHARLNDLERELSLGAGHRRPRRSRLLVRQRDVRARDDLFRFVDDRAGNGACRRLGEADPGPEQGDEQAADRHPHMPGPHEAALLNVVSRTPAWRGFTIPLTVK
jgi:hypothetical protein